MRVYVGLLPFAYPPTPARRRVVTYSGKLQSGREFDSGPFDFILGGGQVIEGQCHPHHRHADYIKLIEATNASCLFISTKGWDRGLMGTCNGESLTLTIPAAMGSVSPIHRPRHAVAVCVR